MNPNSLQGFRELTSPAEIKAQIASRLFASKEQAAIDFCTKLKTENRSEDFTAILTEYLAGNPTAALRQLGGWARQQNSMHPVALLNEALDLAGFSYQKLTPEFVTALDINRAGLGDPEKDDLAWALRLVEQADRFGRGEVRHDLAAALTPDGKGFRASFMQIS